MGAGSTDCFEIGGKTLVGAIRHKSCQDVGLEEIIRAVGRFERDVAFGQLARGFYVGVHLVVKAAFEFGALPRELLRVGRDVLETRGGCGDRLKVFHPGGAAKFSAARPRASYASCLLTRSDLLHLNAHVEGIGKHLDELAEVHAPVGDVIENRLIAVALILHIADFHFEFQLVGNLAGANHRVVLAGLRFMVFLHIHRPRLAIDTLDFSAGLHVDFLHLQRHELPRERYSADVVAGRCLNGHDVALNERQVVVVAIIALARVLKLHLHEVSSLGVAGHVRKIVERVELTVGTPAAFGANALQAASAPKGIVGAQRGKVFRRLLFLCIFDWIF